jgi:hypothetical protein
MENYIKALSLKTSDQDKESVFIGMEIGMKETLLKIKEQVMVLCISLMEIVMMANGLITKNMDKVLITIQLPIRPIKVYGSKD